MTSPLPARVGRYEIVDRLGVGGMGVVYLATDPLLRRTVAIKILPGQDDELRERFAREARSAAALRHNNIVTIYDVGEDDGRPFIAMEFVDGESMAEMIRRRPPLPVQRRLQLVIDLCAGLGYAHRSGIIHRDIKPANLMITTEGSLKILDFGLARVTTDATSAGLTRVGSLMGTPHYMSPEQVEGMPADQASDIFSVGLVLYEILTFRKAFPGESAQAILLKIVQSEPTPVAELLPTIDAELERVVTRATVKDRAQRYPNLAALASALERVRTRLGADQPTAFQDAPAPAGDKPPKSGRGARSTDPSLRNIPNLDAIAERRRVQMEQHLRAATEAFEAGKYETAIEHCENAAVLNPQENKALELLQQAHRAIEDRQLRGWLDLAKQQLSKGALTEAEALIEQSLKLRSGSVDALALQRELKEKRRDREREAERSRAVRSAVERAKRNMEEGALEAAARCASEALAYDPEHEEAKALKAQALEILEERRRQREHEEAALDVVAKARDVARAENIHAAVKLLRQFDPPHPLVTEAIADFDAEIAYLEERRKEEEARLQREEEERRLREEEDRQRRDEEERRRLADQERQRRAEEERQRRAEDERQRRAEEERRRLQAAEEKRRRDQAAAFKAQARDAMNIGEFAQALAALQSARATLPGDDEIDGLVTSVEKARDAAEAAARVRRSVERSLVGARASLERDELEEALRLVASALKHSPDDSDALALQGEVRDAIAVRTRQDTERRAAEGAMASAVDMFQAGDIDGAIGALEAFAPSALVRAMLEELRGEKARREEEARVALEAKRRAEEEAIARAQEEREQREREARARAEEEERQRKEREAKAKAAEEERQRKEREAKAKAAEEERQRKEREAKARADEEARQRQEREAKAKAAEEERQRKEREARARAEEEARQRREREAKAKAAEEERQRKEREAKARAEEEERQRKEREARAKAAEDERRRVEEEARRAAEARRKAEEAAALRAREARARELAETAVGPLVEPPAVELPSSSNIPTMVGLDRPDELPTTIEFPLDADVSEDIASGDVSGGALPFSKPVMAAIAASLALVLAVGGYLLTRAPAADAVATPTPIPGPAAPPAGGPTPAVDAKRLLQDARDLYLQRNSPSAIASALSVPENAPERAEAVALLEQIRGDAQALALADRRDAEDAGKTGEDVFKQAVGMSDQAQKLTGLADVPKAVSLYENSSALFRQVTSTGWSAARFVQQARTELRARRTPQAIDFALKGLGQEPGNRDALALLQSVRTNAANLADAAARQARTAGATEANSPFFKDARSKEDAARRLQTPRDTLAAINQYDAARAAYVNAVAEAKASDTLAAERNAQLLNGFLQRADERLKAGDLTGASTAIAEAAKLDADNPRVAELRRSADAAQTGQRAEQQRRIEIERALGEASKLTNDNEAIQSLRAALTRFPGNSEINDAIGRRTKARDDRIDDLVRRAKGAGDAQAITLLTEALGYNAGRTDISEEIERRRKAMGGGGNAAELRTRREGEVLRALNGYEAAYASRSVEDFLRVAPFRTRQQIENEFKSFRSIQLNVENASIALDDNGAGATVNCTISSVRVPAGVSAKPINDRRAWQLRLANVGGAWQITGATPAR